MNKIVYTGPTCYLGQCHFTSGKTYDIHSNKALRYEGSVYYIIADNDIWYYINMGNSRSPYNSLEIVDSLDSNFMTLQKWRNNQIESVLQ